jgi:Kef-type K+ transport system membrane component KefB
MIFLIIQFNDFIQRPITSPILVFSLLLLVILISPFLLRKLNIPGIIGLIISGVIIGPHGLNLVENNSAVELFATIGLLYIMFIAGLDLDIIEFGRNKNKSILFGIYTFIIPLLIGFPVCYYLLHLNFFASLLVSSMFSTHTLVSYPIVSKLGITRNQAVAATVGGTILTDTSVLLLLAVIIGAWQGSLDDIFWYRIIIGSTFLLSFVFIVIPRLSKWFFKKMESEKHSHYIFVLAIVFFSAFLSQLAGVEPIIGAFVSGLALNRVIPHTSALMNRIEFIGNSLFIPFFLISVGMLVNVSIIFNGPTALIIAITLTIVALFSKWIAAYFTQITLKYTRNQRKLIFGLSSSHAAATLAVIVVGFNAGILNENIINGTILLILITCIVSSFVTDRASRKIILNTKVADLNETRINNDKREHILLPIANLLNMEKLLDFAILIKDKSSANPITLLSIVPNNKIAEENIRIARSKLESFVKLASATETIINITATIDYNIAGGISRTCKELMADTIILGWPKKENFVNKLFGQRMERLVRDTDRMLLVCYLSKSYYHHNRICVYCPEYAELEKGFTNWLHKVIILSLELNLNVLFYCCIRTKEAIVDIHLNKQVDNRISFDIFSKPEDYKLENLSIKADDLAIFVVARSGSVSYRRQFDSFPEQFEENYPDNNFIFIYPIQHNQGELLNAYADIPQQAFF